MGQQAENFQKMAMAMARDIRVILVKLADRLHNLRTLGSLRPDKRRRIARETLDIYAPIANRLGLNSIRVEMEDLCFEAMYPMRSEMIRKAVAAARGHRSEVVNNIATAVRGRLTEVNISARVVGREKHLYSIYKPIPGRFKDYIAIPKTNGYQSLHTTLIGIGGLPVEMQIRTEEMEAMANHGIAAHWLYKAEGDHTS